MSAYIFYRERSPRHLAEQNRRITQLKLAMQRPEARRLRTLPYDAHLSVRDSLTEDGGGAQEIVQALARVHSRDRQHRRASGPRAGRVREAAPPVDEVDRLREDRQLRAREVVDVVGDRGRVLTRHEHPIGARGVGPLPARLHAEQRAHHTPLVPKLVGDDPLQHHDETAAAPARP